MSYLLEDGRYIMASWDDIHNFFSKNRIENKRIKSIVPSMCDYQFRDWETVELYSITKLHCATDTDGYVSLVFDDGSSMEFEIPGSAPIILGCGNISDNKEVDDAEYSMDDLFKYVIGKKIAKIEFEKTNKRMIFPCYCGIDMSSEDEGIQEIRLKLEDGSYLVFNGFEDFFKIEHHNSDGTIVMVDVCELRRNI